MHRTTLEKYKTLLDTASVEILEEIVNTAVKMQPKTRSIFLRAIKSGDIDIVRERLAGWMYKNQEG